MLVKVQTQKIKTMRPHLADGEPKMRRMATPDERPFSRQTGPFAGLEARSVLAGNLSGLKKKSGLVRNQRLRLWRARFRSFRFLCFRIFLRRFLITLPTIGASFALGPQGARSPEERA